MMLRFLIVVCVLALSSAALSACGALIRKDELVTVDGAGYIAPIDVPLPDGFKLQSEQTSVYDTPDGRIIEAVALGDTRSPVQVEEFFSDTLSALGWEKIRPLTYHREGEELHITLASTDEGTVIQFSLHPLK